MKRICCCALLCILATSLPAAARAGPTPLSGGVGLGYSGLLPLEESAGLLLLNLRLGGFLQYSPGCLGPGAPGIEAGAWVLALPVAQGILMAEVPLLLTYDLRPTSRCSVTIQAGYCLLLGVGESLSLIHSAAAGARLSLGRFFLQAGAIFVFGERADTDSPVSALPHLEVGWRIR